MDGEFYDKLVKKLKAGGIVLMGKQIHLKEKLRKIVEKLFTLEKRAIVLNKETIQLKKML